MAAHFWFGNPLPVSAIAAIDGNCCNPTPAVVVNASSNCKVPSTGSHASRANIACDRDEVSPSVVTFDNGSYSAKSLFALCLIDTAAEQLEISASGRSDYRTRSNSALRSVAVGARDFTSAKAEIGAFLVFGGSRKKFGFHWTGMAIRKSSKMFFSRSRKLAQLVGNIWFNFPVTHSSRSAVPSLSVTALRSSYPTCFSRCRTVFHIPARFYELVKFHN